MNKIEELISELCSNGVEFKNLGDVCDVFTGGEAPEDSIKEKKPRDGYIYPIYSNGIGENALWGFAKSYRIDKKAVTFSSIGTVGYPTLRQPKFIPIIRLKVLVPKDENILHVGFLKYVLETVEFEQQKSTVPNINANMLKSIQIPIPPIEIQTKIVRILDTFSNLISELDNELILRRKQFQYYRDQLLTFDSDVEFVSLGDVCKILRGKRLTSKELIENGKYPVIHGGTSPMGYYDKSNRKAGTTIVINTGNAGCVFYIDVEFWSSDACFSLYPCEKILDRFLYFVVSSKENLLKQKIRVAAMPTIDSDSISNLKIPVPPIEIQTEIVRILDTFTNLISELDNELILRKKQYAYYRDKVLTFTQK